MDDDGDGVPNAMDNCPKVFNPMPARWTAASRPTSTATEPATSATRALSTPPTGAPRPTRTIWTATPCRTPPTTARSRRTLDQADMDGDGHGDACDKCADIANPGYAALPRGRADDQGDPRPGRSQAPGRWATSSRSPTSTSPRSAPATGNSQGFYVQDTTLHALLGHLHLHGRHDAATVQIGNKVTITGAYTEFNGLSGARQHALSSPSQDPGTTLPFAPIDVADPATLATGGAMAEGYESMLVKIGAVARHRHQPRRALRLR
ncbi:MAG: thrombospondin type 3 repeat-containing protein [Microthrixaceae bacterium]